MISKNKFSDKLRSVFVCNQLYRHEIGFNLLEFLVLSELRLEYLIFSTSV
jgi:hypothetical protein